MSLQLGAVVVLPSMALALLESYSYATWQWPFGFGSPIPDFIAAVLSLGGLLIVLATSSARLRWKLVGACVAPRVQTETVCDPRLASKERVNRVSPNKQLERTVIRRRGRRYAAR